jgi:hypothetical protein
MISKTPAFTVLLLMCILSGCASDTTGEKFFKHSDNGERNIPFGGRSECLPFENYTPPDDCPDE